MLLYCRIKIKIKSMLKLLKHHHLSLPQSVFNFLHFKRLQSSFSSSQTNGTKMNKSSTLKNEKVALVACGSFNPITFMHLRMFELAKDYLNESYPSVKLNAGIISPVSDGYGKSDLVDGNHRRKMCELAVSDDSWVQIGMWELEQPEWMPTVQVLKHYQENLSAKNVADRTMLLCGADFLHSFSTKGLWLESDVRTIIQQHGIIVVSRPTHDVNKIINSSSLVSELRSHIHVVSEYFENALSSTSVRRAVREKKSIKFLIPDAVIQYIKQNNLYHGLPTNPNGELAPLKKYRKGF